MTPQLGDINAAKVIMHEAFNKALDMLRTEPIEQLSYILGHFDAYDMVCRNFGILNEDELRVLREMRDAIPAQRHASGIDRGQPE